MNYRLMLMLNAIVAAVFGAGYLFVPATLLVFFGTTDYVVSTLLAARFMGGALLTVGLLLWFAKDLADTGAQKSVGFGMLASSIGGFILSLIGVASASGVIRANGWILIVIHVLLGLGYAYLLFLKPASPEAKPRNPRKAKGAK